MRTWLKVIAAVVLVCLVAVVAICGWILGRQGVPEAYWRTWTGAKVTFDVHGVPTIDAGDWDAVVRAQGYVVASQRLWQMDLIRRKAGGRLAEFFGSAAYEHDETVQLEDRLELSRSAAATLPAEERRFCDLYADGVNEYIKDFSGRWGLEYVLIREEPEPWTCADSLLVVLEMSEALTTNAEPKAQQSVWRRNLSPAWKNFLFTVDHPWNHPYFDGPRAPAPVFPPVSEALPARPIDAVKEASATVDDPEMIGSNNWAWRGPSGTYVANDPHLGYSVPGIWFAQRLRVAADEWAVGVSVPGLPGVIIGMNPHVAWAFTNTGEDVDDYLKETLSPDGGTYLADAAGAWLPVVTKTFAIKVKDEAQPRQVKGLFTHRGPVAKRKFLDGYYARQWLSLKPGMLRMPSLAICRAKDLASFDQALDGMVAPSQNAIFADRQGNMGYRMTGTGVVRRVSGIEPLSGPDGEWHGFEPASSRRRLFYKKAEDPAKVRFLASANERIWVDPNGGRWYSEDRKERIVRFLGSRDNLKRSDMEALQVDTESRFRKLLLRWVASRAGVVGGPGAARLIAWRTWDGSSHGNPVAFSESEVVEVAMLKLLLGRVQATFPHAEDRDVPYKHAMRRAWETALLLAPGEEGVAPFGLRADDVARFLVGRVVAASATLQPHQIANTWRKQHPFVGRVPFLGPMFRIAEYPQWGSPDVVMAETPDFGPSVRLVWDLSRPWESTWTFPVGQSGHVLSYHFQDWHEIWPSGVRMAVFPSDWSFAGRPSAPPKP